MQLYSRSITYRFFKNRLQSLEVLIGAPPTDAEPLEERFEVVRYDIDNIRRVLENHMVEAKEKFSQLERSSVELYQEVTILKKGCGCWGQYLG